MPLLKIVEKYFYEPEYIPQLDVKLYPFYIVGKDFIYKRYYKCYYIFKLDIRLNSKLKDLDAFEIIKRELSTIERGTFFFDKRLFCQNQYSAYDPILQHPIGDEYHEIYKYFINEWHLDSSKMRSMYLSLGKIFFMEMNDE